MLDSDSPCHNQTLLWVPLFSGTFKPFVEIAFNDSSYFWYWSPTALNVGLNWVDLVWACLAAWDRMNLIFKWCLEHLLSYKPLINDSFCFPFIVPSQIST